MEGSEIVQQMWLYKMQKFGGTFSIQQIHITNHNANVNIGVPSAAHTPTHEKCVSQFKQYSHEVCMKCGAYNDLLYGLCFVCLKQKA